MTAPDAGEVISLHDLRKEFRMGDTTVRALRGISFSMRRGDYVSIMGASGSGKSTLLNILGCLDTPTGGDYFLEGINVAGMSDRQLSAVRGKKFGFIFQSFNLISQLTVLENIEVPLFYQGWSESASRERSRHLADMVGLSHRLFHRPNELSGGQRQRVAIARALANDPAIIFADEPTGNLDHQTGLEIMAVLDALSGQGRTIVLVTHEAAIARHARRIITISDGGIADDRLTGSGSSCEK